MAVRAALTRLIIEGGVAMYAPPNMENNEEVFDT